MITNRIINFNDHVDTYSYSGPIGDHLVEQGLAEFEELAVEFVQDDGGEVNVLEVRDETTGQNMWDPQPINDDDWTDEDDEILEAFIAWFDNASVV